MASAAPPLVARLVAPLGLLPDTGRRLPCTSDPTPASVHLHRSCDLGRHLRRASSVQPPPLGERSVAPPLAAPRIPHSWLPGPSRQPTRITATPWHPTCGEATTPATLRPRDPSTPPPHHHTRSLLLSSTRGVVYTRGQNKHGADSGGGRVVRPEAGGERGRGHRIFLTGVDL